MRAIVFSGPSLPPAAVPNISGIEWRPPLKQGDLHRAALERPDAIIVIDGYFETTPTVWHDEILFALSNEIEVYGAASTGALRAAELDAFGMRGVGRIYEWFRDGILEDDDEVARPTRARVPAAHRADGECARDARCRNALANDRWGDRNGYHQICEEHLLQG
jgi:hypothetical protein